MSNVHKPYSELELAVLKRAEAMSKHTAAQILSLAEAGEEHAHKMSPGIFSEVLRAYADLLAAMEKAEPVAWVKSSEWNDAKVKRQSFNGWRHNYGDCDMVLFAHPPAQAWQPIESAPKDGTRILVRGDRYLGPCVASAGWDADTPNDIRWEVMNDIVVEPTLWQPLPPPPEGAGHE